MHDYKRYKMTLCSAFLTACINIDWTLQESIRWEMFRIALKCYLGWRCVLFYNFGRGVLCFSTDQQSVPYSCVSDVIWGYEITFYNVAQFFTQRGHYDTLKKSSEIVLHYYIHPTRVSIFFSCRLGPYILHHGLFDLVLQSV